jgi:hypothetical protein
MNNSEKHSIRGKNIICFGSENFQYPGFQQTVMRLLARHNRVIYVNALGSRRLSLKLSELPLYLKRAQRLFQKNVKQSAGFMVYNARIIPLVYNNIINKINKILLQKQLLELISRMDFENYILWIGTPTLAFALDLFDPVLTVYNPVDRYYAFPFVNSAEIRKYEQKIAQRADVIICTSEAIQRDLLPHNENCLTVTHGVDFNSFNSALSIESMPDDIRNISQPIVGYFGGLTYRVNYGLISEVAMRYPTSNIVLIGKKWDDLGKSAELKKLKHVHTLGFRDYSLLPMYLKQFRVCLIPYHVNELMEGVDPIKLREYFCLGKPVVSVDLPEVKKFGGLVYIGKNEEDFVKKVGVAMRENNPDLVEKRLLEAKRNDWNNKIRDIAKILLNAMEGSTGI